MAFIAPIVAGISSLAGGVSGGGLAAAGSLLSGVAGLASGIYQMNVANENARIAEQNAARRIEQGQTEQFEQDQQTRAMLGEQESIQAASGLSLGSASSVRTRRAARELGRRDALRVREAADWDAYNFKVEAANQRAAGTMAGLQGGMSLLGGFLGAAGKGSLTGSSKSTAKTFDPWTSKKGAKLGYVS